MKNLFGIAFLIFSLVGFGFVLSGNLDPIFTGIISLITLIAGNQMSSEATIKNFGAIFLFLSLISFGLIFIGAFAIVPGAVGLITLIAGYKMAFTK
jgi:hypothetical protein